MSFETRRPLTVLNDTAMRVEPSRPQAPKALPLHQALDLTGGERLANIQLGDQLYTLRITKAEKLILTK